MPRLLGTNNCRMIAVFIVVGVKMFFVPSCYVFWGMSMVLSLTYTFVFPSEGTPDCHALRRKQKNVSIRLYICRRMQFTVH